jgi:hypothetical protein
VSQFVKFFGEIIAKGVVAIVTPVPTVDGRWCPVGLSGCSLWLQLECGHT